MEIFVINSMTSVWDENHEKMGKGVTLSNVEISKLKELLDKII